MKPNLLNSVKLSQPKKNAFDLSHDVKLSCDMGELVPVMWEKCVPGDKFTIGCESLVRFAPLVSPMMHRVDVTVHYFFVPYRLLWNNWEKWITKGGTVDGDTFPLNQPSYPYVDIDADNWTRLADFLGIPQPEGGNTERVSAFPFAAYLAIWNEYYRDQNVMPDIWGDDWEKTLGDGSNNPGFDEEVGLGFLRKRSWEHDYFTSALPFAQKGDAVSIPIGAFHDVSVLAKEPPTTPGDTAVVLTGTGVPSAGGDNQTVPFGTPDVSVNDLYAETSELEAEASTITDLRRAFKLQEWMEKIARGGSRLTEMIRVMFGVKSPDARLQRPEYITGVKSPVQISEVLQTSASVVTLDGPSPQGNMAGHGVGVVSGKYGSYYCQEHGIIMGIMSVMPKTAYQQGIDRKFAVLDDAMDEFWPQFEHIGEQEIKRKEVYAFQGTDGELPFGYIPRYAEYKFANNRVAGQFRTNLDFWHMGRIFATPGDAVLDADFIKADPTTRVFAVEDAGEGTTLYVHHLNKVMAVRPMSKYGNPTF